VDEKIEVEILAVHAKFWPQKNAILQKRNAALKAIPHFWHNACDHHPSLSQLFNALDKSILKACTSIESIENNPAHGFDLIFHFDDNKYFSNKSLKIAYVMATADSAESAQPSPITWSDAKYSADEDRFKSISHILRNSVTCSFIRRFVFFLLYNPIFSVSIFASMFQSGESALEMKFAIDLIREMVHDPIAAYQGLMPGDQDGDEDGDDGDDGFFGEDGMYVFCFTVIRGSSFFSVTRNHHAACLHVL
jgi:hypothetical protein